MPVGIISMRTVADVKCYYCGHVSGQIVGVRGKRPKVTDFIPRPGYTGTQVKPGMRLRCERCRGPVFLEDATMTPSLERPRRPAGTPGGPRKAAA